MTLRKITVDNSVRIFQNLNRREKIKQKQTLVNKTKKFHKTIKSFSIMFQHQDSNSLSE